MKKQSIQILLAVAGIGVAVYVYLQSKKKKQVASPADKPGSPFYTATGAASPAALSSGAGQSATQGLQNRRSGTAQNPGGTKPDVWGQAAGAVGGLLAGLFGKKNSGGASGGGSKLGSGLGSNYKGPGSITGRNAGAGGAGGRPDDPMAADRDEFGEPITGGPRQDYSDEYGGDPGQMFKAEDFNYDLNNDYAGGDNNGEGASNFDGYGGNDGYGYDSGYDGSEGSYDAGGYDYGSDYEGGSIADFESD